MAALTTAILLAAFLGGAAWAFSRKRTAEFDAAAATRFALLDPQATGAIPRLSGQHASVIVKQVLDIRSGRVSYAVLSFGGFMGIGDKLFAVPWSALTLDTENKRFVLNVDKERLSEAPGFDKGKWPNMADPAWSSTIHSYYGTQQHRDEPTH